MIGSFNPYTAGNSPQSPNISVDTVAQLLGGANAGIQSLIGGIRKAGEIDRSSKVNELLAGGGLQGLTEEQQRQKLAQMTGGQSLNPLVQANVADVMANQRANEIARASATAALGLEDRKSANDMNIEKLKSQLGLTADTALAKTKGEIEAENAKRLFGYDSQLLGQKGSQARDLLGFENELKVKNFDENKSSDRFMSMGKGKVLDRATGEVRDVGISQIENAEDLIKSLPNDAENYVRGLTRNQQENFKEAYASGNIAWQPLIVDKKSGAKSGGFFVDLNAKTPLGITISNIRRKEK